MAEDDRIIDLDLDNPELPAFFSTLEQPINMTLCLSISFAPFIRVSREIESNEFEMVSYGIGLRLEKLKSEKSSSPTNDFFISLMPGEKKEFM